MTRPGARGGKTHTFPSVGATSMSRSNKEHAERKRRRIGAINSIYHIYHFLKAYSTCINLFIHLFTQQTFTEHELCAEHRHSKSERKTRSPASWDLHLHKRNAPQTGKQVTKTAGSCCKYGDAQKERSGEGCWGEGGGGQAG